MKTTVPFLLRQKKNFSRKKKIYGKKTCLQKKYHPVFDKNQNHRPRFFYGKKKLFQKEKI
jgi:hypothetical protein